MRIYIDFINDEVDPAMATVTDVDTQKQYDIPVEHFQWRENWTGAVPPGWFEDGNPYHRHSTHKLVGMTIYCADLLDQSYTVHQYKPLCLGKVS